MPIDSNHGIYRDLLHRHVSAMDVGAVKAPTIGKTRSCKRLRIGLDIAKSVFQVHGVDAEGNVILRRPAQTPLHIGILPEAATVPGRY